MIGTGDCVSILVCAMGVGGALINTRPEAVMRYYSFIIWTIANGIALAVNVAAFYGLITLSLGFIMFAIQNAAYLTIDLWGVKSTRKEMEDERQL